MFLKPEQIVELTDRETKPAQCRRLRQLKIAYLYEPPGEIKVLVTAVEARSADRACGHFRTEPDFAHFPQVA